MYFKFKYCFLSFLYVGILAVSCARTEKDQLGRVISFDQNLVNTQEPEFVCRLSEDSILLKRIVNFTVLNDTSFVVLDDGRGVYLYHISGTFKKQFGSSGQAGGEMISPSLLYATSNFVYIWCSSLKKFLIFDHEANFKYELSGIIKGVNKFVVNPSDEVLYIYTSSGFFDEPNNKRFDVIEVYNIAEKSSEKFGERGPEDEVLSTFYNSGGLYVDTERFIYLHPGNLIIHDLDLNSDKTVQYTIEDKAFNTTKITSQIRDIIEDRPKLTDYLFKNSIVKDIYKDNDQFIIFSEIGQYDFDERDRVTNTQKRKVKMYILDSSFKPVRTITYDINSSNNAIYSGAMYFMTLNLGEDDQTITLNRFFY